MPRRRCAIALSALAAIALLALLAPKAPQPVLADSTGGAARHPAAEDATLILTKTVGIEPGVCSATDAITVAGGTEVTYCYQVLNAGPITLGMHDLVDSELGDIVDELEYPMAPGTGLTITVAAAITRSTMNTATWTAYNPGPADMVTAEDTATVTVMDAVRRLYMPAIRVP